MKVSVKDVNFILGTLIKHTNSKSIFKNKEITKTILDTIAQEMDPKNIAEAVVKNTGSYIEIEVCRNKESSEEKTTKYDDVSLGNLTKEVLDKIGGEIFIVYDLSGKLKNFTFRGSYIKLEDDKLVEILDRNNLKDEFLLRTCFEERYARYDAVRKFVSKTISEDIKINLNHRIDLIKKDIENLFIKKASA